MKSSSISKWIHLCNKIIEAGLIFLVIFTAFSFGAVEVWAYSLMEFVIFGCSFLWILKHFLHSNDRYESTRNSSTNNRHTRQHATKDNLKNTPKPSVYPLYIPIILFFLLALFQLVPLPPKIVKFISPRTYELYSVTLEGYDDGQLGKEALESSPHNNTDDTIADSASPNQYRSLSINPHASKRILLQILAYITVFFLIINNFTFDGVSPLGLHHRIEKKFRDRPFHPRKRQQRNRYLIPINRLVRIIVITGFSVALLGILQKLTDTNKIFWVLKMPIHAHPFATFVNRNNFAGYINMIIPIGLATLLSQQPFTGTTQYHGYSLTRRMRRWIVLMDPWLRKNGLYLISCIVMVSALIFSGSRGGIVCFIATLIVFHFIYRLGRSQTTSLAAQRLTPIWVVLFVLVIAVLWSNPDETIKRFTKLSDFKGYLEHAGRVRVYLATYEMAKDFPILGAGLGTFPNLYFTYREVELARSTYVAAHCDYLQIMAETGIIGFCVVLLFIIVYAVRILAGHRKKSRVPIRLMSTGMIASIFAMLFYSLIGFNIQIPANALLFSEILGITYLISLNHGD